MRLSAGRSTSHRSVWKCRTVVALILALPMTTAIAQENDDRDIEYATGALLPTEEEVDKIPSAPLTRAFLPELVDLSERMPPVGSQGQLGSCVSWAVGYAARSYYSKIEQNGKLTKASIPSPYYMHGILRVPDPKGKWRCDGGAYIHKAIALLRDEGSASLADVAYTDKRCEPPSATLRETIRGKQSFRIKPGKEIVVREAADLDKIKTELAMGHPVIVAVTSDQALHRLRGRRIWSGGGRISGGHAITLVGYKESGQYFKFINSWGTDWGDRGYGRLSYDVLLRGYSWEDEGKKYNVNTVGYSLRVPGVEPLRPESEPEPDPVPGAIVLPEVSCGQLEQHITGERHTISGYVREESDIHRIKAAIGDKDVKLDVALRPWPQCEALMTLRDPLKDEGKPQVMLPAASYKDGDTLSFKVGMAPFEGYLHVAYVQADGNVVNLVQQGRANIQTIGRGTEMTFGDGVDGRAKFTVSEPYGREMVIAISSASPLFPEPRPTVEVERTFLSALRAAILARPDPNLPERRISAAYALLETTGEKP